MEPLISEISKEIVNAVVRRAAWIMLFAALMVGIGAFVGGYWLGSQARAKENIQISNQSSAQQPFETSGQNVADTL